MKARSGTVSLKQIENGVSRIGRGDLRLWVLLIKIAMLKKYFPRDDLKIECSNRWLSVQANAVSSARNNSNFLYFWVLLTMGGLLKRCHEKFSKKTMKFYFLSPWDVHFVLAIVYCFFNI